MAEFLGYMIMLLKIVGCGVLITLGIALMAVIIRCTIAVLFDKRAK